MSNKLVIAISSRALFNLDDSHRVFEEQGLEAFQRYQMEHEERPLEPGEAFPLVQKLLRLNKKLGDRVDVILLSRNSADTGLRVFNSIQHYGLPICRAAFCGGQSPYRYVAAFGCQLFLSTDPEDVRAALAQGVAAATLIAAARGEGRAESEQLRIAFDGDAVVFSDEAERIYKESGLAAFADSERAAARQPLSGGPFKPFLEALHTLQSDLPPEQSLLRTALVTARSAPAHERVIRTLRAWNIRIDEALFLGGLPKGEFLRAFGADVFFDDQLGHCDSASRHVATGHVPHGVANAG